jgi:TPR repeat protein
VLLPKDAKKAANYYQKAMTGKEPYAFYRYAMSQIKGRTGSSGPSREEIDLGFKLLNQAAFSLEPAQSPEALIELG